MTFGLPDSPDECESDQDVDQKRPGKIGNAENPHGGEEGAAQKEKDETNDRQFFRIVHRTDTGL